MAATRRGRGRGRKRPDEADAAASVPAGASSSSPPKKRAAPNTTASTSNAAPPALGSSTADVAAASLAASTTTPSSTAMMDTSLKTLKNVEAALSLRVHKMKRSNVSAEVAGSVSLEEWRGFVKDYEWLAGPPAAVGASIPESNIPGAASSVACAANGASERVTSKELNEIASKLQGITSTFAEEERLLFDLLIVTSWNFSISKDNDNADHELYPLYKLEGGKLHVSAPPPISTEEKATTRSRIDILEERFRRSRKFFRWTDAMHGSACEERNGFSEEKCIQWWKHALSVAQSMVADCNKSKANDKKPAAKQQNASSFVESLTAQTNATSNLNDGTANEGSDGKKPTLEERIRARAAARERIQQKKARSKRTATAGNDKRMLLELADALRSYSRRRAGGGALERLENRASANTGDDPTSEGDTARLSVSDFLKDAKTCWNAVLRNATGSGAAISSGSYSDNMGASYLVNVDLGRVLFQLRLRMSDSVNGRDGNDATLSDRRWMEKNLLELLQELIAVVPNWIGVSKLPPSLSSAQSRVKEASTNGDINTSAKSVGGVSGKGTKPISRDSIIVIRNSAVDYNSDVRAKLGGKSSKDTVDGGRKRRMDAFLKQTAKLSGKSNIVGPAAVADSIVPPSFLRRYGKAIIESDKSAYNKAAKAKKG